MQDMKKYVQQIFSYFTFHKAEIHVENYIFHLLLFDWPLWTLFGGGIIAILDGRRHRFASNESRISLEVAVFFLTFHIKLNTIELVKAFVEFFEVGRDASDDLCEVSLQAKCGGYI